MVEEAAVEAVAVEEEMVEVPAEVEAEVVEGVEVVDGEVGAEEVVEEEVEVEVEEAMAMAKMITIPAARTEVQMQKVDADVPEEVFAVDAFGALIAFLVVVAGF